MLQQALDIRMAVFVDEGVPADLEKDEYDVSPDACRHRLLSMDDGQTVATGRWKTFEPGIAVLKQHRARIRQAIAARDGTGREGVRL
jgi:predicted GNAT family N-acyltransferase